MQDLNDMMFFARVVEAGGFMAASRVLGVPKSRLSRRVALLEEQLGVRLLQRTTRRLALTDIGSQYYQRCQAMLAEAEAAADAIASATAEPRGLIRVSCPELLAKGLLGPSLPRFLQRYPKVRVWLEATNRRVDLIEEGIDVALRVRHRVEDSANLVVRPLGTSQVILVASPALAAGLPPLLMPADLDGLPFLAMSRADGRQEWALLDQDGHVHHLQIDQPRLMTDDLIVLLDAALAGMGVAALPRMVCEAALKDGRLLRVLPGFDSPQGVLQAAYPTRRGLLPAVRAFIDFLVEDLPGTYVLPPAPPPLMAMPGKP